MKYISLKEASQISGYAPDYLGQLIRQGKLPGKQVYSNVSWVTTEEAVRAYLEAKKNRTEFKGDAFREEEGRGDAALINLQKRFQKLFRAFLWTVVVMAAAFAILLFYVFSVHIDNRINQRSIEKAQNQAVPAPAQN